MVDSIIQARAPSTRQTYGLKWSLFANWYSSRREDPRRCTIGLVLSFLQERMECRLSPSTLKVYVAAFAAHHDAVDGWPLGKHDLIVRFLKGARRINPSRSPLVPSWDLSIITGVTLAAPFPLTRGYERLFSPPVQFPGGEPWRNPPSSPGSQTGRSSHTGIKGREVHPRIRFLLRSRVDEMCADLHKPFISYLFLVGVTVQSAESLSAAIPLGTSTKRANSKRAITDDRVFFKMLLAPPAVRLGGAV